MQGDPRFISDVLGTSPTGTGAGMTLLFSDGAGIFQPDAKYFHHQLEGDISRFYEREKTTVLDIYSAPPGSQWLCL